MVKLVINKKVNLSGYTLIEGFPGIGLVGTIATSFLVENNKMELIGHIESDKFPPMATVKDGMPYWPVRIYADKKNKIVAIFSDFVIPGNLVYEITDELLKFAKKNKIKEIISPAGMTSTFQVGERQVFAIVSSEKMKKKLEKLGIKFIAQGITTGIAGVLLMKSAAMGFPAFSILVETTPGYPDPEAAAVLLQKLGEYLNISINTSILEEEAKRIHEQLQRTMEQVRAGRMKYQQAEEHLPMYG